MGSVASRGSLVKGPDPFRRRSRSDLGEPSPPGRSPRVAHAVPRCRRGAGAYQKTAFPHARLQCVKVLMVTRSVAVATWMAPTSFATRDTPAAAWDSLGGGPAAAIRARPGLRAGGRQVGVDSHLRTPRGVTAFVEHDLVRVGVVAPPVDLGNPENAAGSRPPAGRVSTALQALMRHDEGMRGSLIHAGSRNGLEGPA